MRLLWIDDEVELLRPFIYSLREKGYDVETATNGPDGLDLLKTGDFDLVLLDQIMAGMSGLEVLRRIKQQDPDLLVTMVTKSDEEVLIDEAYGDMVDDFLIKPFTPPQLVAVLKRLLEKRKLVAERIGRQYLAAMNEPRSLDTPEGWIDYYRTMNRWQSSLGRYGDPALREVQEDRWRTANDLFSRYVEQVYPDWLAGSGPVMSHQVMEEFVRPFWDEKPTYFLLLDAMREDQWEAIQSLLRDYFEIETSFCYSLLPTATPYSRNAIFSGLLPLEILRQNRDQWVFEETGQNRHEQELFQKLLTRLRFRGRSAFHKARTGTELERLRGTIMDSEVRLTVLVVNFLDLLIHSIKSTRVLEEMIPDDASLVAMTKVWFAASPLYGILQALSRRNCRVIITSDHGFLRVRRPAVIHGGRKMSANLRYKHGGALRVDERQALLLQNPAAYMLPVERNSDQFAIAKSDYYFIYPTKPREYEKTYKHSYQHGGVSLWEMIVPVGLLTPKQA